MHIWVQKKIYTLLITILFFSGCGGGSQTASTDSTSQIKEKIIHQGKVIDIKTGKGLNSVKVTIGIDSTMTDKNGFYTLTNQHEKEEVIVNFERAGYLQESTKIKLKSSTNKNTISNYLEQGMFACNNIWTYDGRREINGPHVIIDSATSYTDSNKNIFIESNITAELTYIDVTTDKGKTLFPGSFQGINSNGTIVQFTTYGLVSLLLKDSYGEKLDLSINETITLRFDAVSSLKKPDTLPLWYYNYKEGIWYEEGYAELQTDGSYQGEVSHLGAWSLNRPIEKELGIYKGRIINSDGTPISTARLHAIGYNWISSDLSTNKDGYFEIKVIPNSNFKLMAYDYKNKYGANYNGTIPAIASGEIVED